MGLFDFFKIKTKPKFDIATESDIRIIINNGIVFEDADKFLPWGSPIEALLKTVNGKKRRFADRIVFSWGEHDILKGLKLELSTVYWHHKENSISKEFNSIEFRITSDEEADKYFVVIRDHIINLLGNANEEHSSGTEVIYEWIVVNVKIYLHCYEQHMTNKLHFEISRL